MTPTPPALVSIHDVMPDTLPAVEAILARLKNRFPGPVALLVVPGSGWSRSGLARLRNWAAAGHTLAGHGWRHRCPPPRTIYHRLHSRLLSRNVAEHLSLSADGAAELMRRCAQWFPDHQLPRPSLYVPPAWAMGAVPRRVQRQLPFFLVETLSGVYQVRRDRRIRLPVIGYEADTRERVVSLRWLNAANRAFARRLGWPIRLAIHPFDPQLLMAADLERDLTHYDYRIGYSDLL